MASIFEEFYEYLKTKTAITDEVGTGDNARIYPHMADQGAALPYITYHRVSGASEQHTLSASGVADLKMQVNVWASTSENCETVTEALRESLDGFRGTWDNGTGSIKISRCRLENELERVEQPDDGTAQPVFNGIQEYDISYTRSVPTF